MPLYRELFKVLIGHAEVFDPSSLYKQITPVLDTGKELLGANNS
jgi:hypothetical protein